MSAAPPARHEEYRADAAAYALGALAPSEAERFERHLAECEPCREYVRWLEPATELLPESVSQLEPPRRLKRELLRQVRADAKAERRAAEGRSGLAGFLWRPATALAVVAVLVVGVVGGYALRGGAEGELVPVRPADPDVRAGTMVATLEVEEGERGTLHVEELPPLPSNRVYQAWIQRDGRMVPSTPFVVRRDGANEVAIDGSLEGAEGVYITREPEGGSEEPTPPVLMKAPL